MKKWEAFLALTAVTTIGFLLSLSVIPSEWLWQFLLIEFIPIAFILGYSVSKMERKVAVTIFLVITIFPIVIRGIEASRWKASTIDENNYSELWRLPAFCHRTPSSSWNHVSCIWWNTSSDAIWSEGRLPPCGSPTCTSRFWSRRRRTLKY